VNKLIEIPVENKIININENENVSSLLKINNNAGEKIVYNM